MAMNEFTHVKPARILLVALLAAPAWLYLIAYVVHAPISGMFGLFGVAALFGGLYSLPFTIAAVIWGLIRMSNVSPRERWIILVLVLGAVAGTLLFLAKLGLFMRII
jgi:hypothetical protein